MLCSPPTNTIQFTYSTTVLHPSEDGFDGKYLLSPCKVDHFPTLGDVEVMEGRVEGALEADGRADAADLLIVVKTAMHDGRFDQSDLGDVAEEIHFEI